MPTEQQYLQMCAFKTGVLARMSAKMGAIAGGGNNRQAEALGTFAESIGVAFQIKDDILNIQPGVGWGKDTGDDITEGKITLLVLRALQQAPPKERKELLSILKKHTRDRTEIEKAIAIITSHDSVAYAKGIAERIVTDAWMQLDWLLEDCDAKEKLRLFAPYLIDREV